MIIKSTIKCSARFIGTIMLLVFGFTPFGSNTASADQIFLLFDNIKGESQVIKHQNWSIISAAHWGVSIPKPKSGGGVTRPSFRDLSWTQNMDKSFPPLFKMAASGGHIKVSASRFYRQFHPRNLFPDAIHRCLYDRPRD